MSTIRLAQNLELKYGFMSEAASMQDTINEVKRDLINAYNLYVNSDKAKEPIFQMLTNMNEPFSKSLVHDFERLIAHIKTGTIEQIYTLLNGMLKNIAEAKKSGSVRTFIHDSIRVTKDSERNYREHVKSKFETVLSRVSSIVEKQAKILRKFIPDADALGGGAVDPQRKELSKEKLLIFMKGPAAAKYGLDSINVMEKVLQFPDLRQKVTTLINAIDRGLFPLDGPEVSGETAAIAAAFKLKETNESAFEDPEANLGNPQLELIQRKQRELDRAQRLQSLQPDPAFIAQRDKQEQERLKLQPVAEQDRLEKEQELLNKYNSLSFSDWLKRSTK